jgi:hypothetical protein
MEDFLILLPLEEIVIATAGIGGSIIVAFLTYHFTKKQEIGMSIKQNKMGRYDELVRNLTQLVKSHCSPKDTQAFVNSYYRAGVYASTEVLAACKNLLDSLENRKEPVPIEDIESTVDSIYNAIRKDNLESEETDHQFNAFYIGVDERLKK